MTVERILQSVDASIRNSQPLEAELSVDIMEVAEPPLINGLRKFRLHDHLLLPRGKFAEKAARHAHYAGGPVSLSALLSRAAAGKRVRISPAQVRTQIAMQLGFLTQYLSPNAEMKFRHVVAVQTPNRELLSRMQPLGCVTFTCSKSRPELPDQLWPLNGVRMQLLQFVAREDGRPMPLMRIGKLLVADTEEFTSDFSLGTEPGESGVYDFGLTPGRGRKNPKRLPADCPVAALNGLAMYDAMAEVAVGGMAPPGTTWPEVFIVENEFGDFVPEIDPVSPYLLDAMLGRLLVWWSVDRSSEAVRKTMFDPKAEWDVWDWLKVLEKPDVREQLALATNDPLEVLQRLSPENQRQLLDAIWVSEILPYGNRSAIPLAMFPPNSSQKPWSYDQARYVVKFGPEHFGRHDYSGGVVSQLDKAAACRVFAA